MKVIYQENKQFRDKYGFGQCPDLTDGRTYEAENEIEVIDRKKHYFVFDNDCDGQNYDEVDPTPYLAHMFKVVQ